MRAASFPQAMQQWGNTVITAPFTQKAYFKQNNLTHLCAATALHDIIWQMSKRKTTAIRSKYGGYFNQKRKKKKKKDELNVVIQTRILTAKRTRTTSLVFFLQKLLEEVLSHWDLILPIGKMASSIFYLPCLSTRFILKRREQICFGITLFQHCSSSQRIHSEDPI